jgi:phospholipid/cholesterol/gamma-HCH transport system substrate-binding protein
VRRPYRLAALGATTAVLAGALSGCGSLSLSGVPLPGGASLGSSPREVTVQLRDALDLVPQSSVKVNNVSVGEVRSIDLDPKTWLADVHVAINNGVPLPANSVAQLKQTTLLGEKYIEIDPPTDQPATGQLVSGSVIPVDRTNRFPEAEEVFGALSMLLNGGGIGQVRNISVELNKALAGHEGDARALLDDLNTLTTQLDDQKGSITDSLDGLNRLSSTLVDQRQNLDKVLTDLQPGLAVLNEQRPQLVEMLRSLDRLSGTATDVIHRSQSDLKYDLTALQPTLRELNRSGEALPNSLQILATPPFVDSAVDATHGDYMNLNLSLDLNLQTLLDIVLGSASTAAVTPSTTTTLPPSVSKLFTLPQASPNAGAGNSQTPLNHIIPGLGG